MENENPVMKNKSPTMKNEVPVIENKSPSKENEKSVMKNESPDLENARLSNGQGNLRMEILKKKMNFINHFHKHHSLLLRKSRVNEFY